MRMYDIIEKKKLDMSLSEEEIRFFIQGFTNGSIPDYQASALMMAIYFNGMDGEETRHLTMAMAESGDMLDLSSIPGMKVDKHSTGGVGDKTSLVLAPMVASLGVPVAKMSGRGLGHTGGTIDKLESFKGFTTNISMEAFLDNVKEINMAIVGQTANLAPADKKLYALRDVTATVDNISLIASSIMSKKIASGADAIILDVKTGNGAFMKTEADAIALAKEMVEIGNGLGRETIAVISDMNQPLGYAVGNALEVKEVISALQGEGPSDLMELCVALGSRMLVAAKATDSLEGAQALLSASIRSGSALEKFKAFVEKQGGNPDQVDNMHELPRARYLVPVQANEDGYIASMASQTIGIAAMALGGGRVTKDSEIDHSVGIVLKKKVGDPVRKGEVICEIHSNDDEKTLIAKEKMMEAVNISKKPVAVEPLIKGIVDKDGWHKIR